MVVETRELTAIAASVAGQAQAVATLKYQLEQFQDASILYAQAPAEYQVKVGDHSVEYAATDVLAEQVL